MSIKPMQSVGNSKDRDFDRIDFSVFICYNKGKENKKSYYKL